MDRTSVIYTIYTHSHIAMRPQDPAGCPPRCLSRLPAASGASPAESCARCLFMTIIGTFYILFPALAAGGPGTGLGRLLRARRAAGTGQRGGSALAAPPLLRMGASAARGRQRAGGTIRARERGARRTPPVGNGPARAPAVSWREGAVPNPRNGRARP